jgi:hypothetical protein
MDADAAGGLAFPDPALNVVECDELCGGFDCDRHRPTFGFLRPRRWLRDLSQSWDKQFGHALGRFILRHE